MQINIIAIVIICILALIVNLLKLKNKKRILLLLAFGVLYVILIIREPASDLKTYLYYFRIINAKSFIETIKFTRFELLYVLLNRIIGVISTNERVFIMITSLIMLIGPYAFIKKYSNNYLLSITLYIALGLFHYNFYVLRQSIAVIFLLKSIDFIKDKKKLKFFATVLIATLFHKSSLIFLIAYPICMIKIKPKYLITIFFISVIIFTLKTQLTNSILNIAYSDYYGYKINDGYSRLLLISIMFIFVSLILCNMKEKYNNMFLLNICAISIPIQILATEVSVISRMANIFIFPFIVLIPIAVSNLKNKNQQIFGTFIIELVSVLYTAFFIIEKEYKTIL